MTFFSIGKLKTVDDLRTVDLKLKEVKRSDIKIAIIDDEPFEMMEIIKRHGFIIDQILDTNNLNILAAYDIIICDINGVGKDLSREFQGAWLIKEIYKLYPFKIIILYTGISYDARYSEYLKRTEYSIKKDVSSEAFVEKLDAAIDKLTDPIDHWKKLKNYLFEHDIPTFDVAMIEDDFVNRLLQHKNFDNFPKSKIQKSINPELFSILQSFATNFLIKLITV